MNRNERYESFEEALRSALLGWQADMWSALPGIVQSVDLTKKTCVVQVSIKMRVTSAKDGTQSWVAISPLLDCPIFFPSGGGCTLTFPVKNGDECLVVFSSRCIDAWWQNGGVQNQPILRMHDLSDGFAFVGISSVPKVQGNISATCTELRSDDGASVIRLDPSSKTIDIVTSGKVGVSAQDDVNVTTTTAATINADTINLNGNVIINGTPYKDHEHFGVQSGGAVSGGVVTTIYGTDVTF